MNILFNQLVLLLKSLTTQHQETKETFLERTIPESFSAATETVISSIDRIGGNFLGHIPYIIASLIMLLLTWGVARLVRHFGGRIFRHTTSRRSLKNLFVRLLTSATWLVGLLLAAMVLFPGLTPTKALGAVGLLSVAIGLAFKDIFENFFAGILILWRFPIEEGDFIECQDICGRVEVVEVRNTNIRKVTGELVVVPNLFLFKNPCEVITNRVKRRVTIMVGVAYQEKLSKSVSIIESAVASCQTVRKEDPIEIFPKAFGESSIDIEVCWWTGSTPLQIRQSRAEVVTAVKSALDQAGIEIPFPYRTLTFKEPLKLE
ncbi:mechanosensitive ion channel family protein [Microbulbifer variabilis]|uniref:mechanosensitive ion channel family protein n=1 Tax=Microbulbifer variabilis TaxID=266805 RepID=UPI001CFCF3DA|nr:mechanosensitive ion channel family protein [Microbulbifer variabilis]